MRRFEDAGRDYLRDIAPESFEAGHVVLNVAPGGGSYTVRFSARTCPAATAPFSREA